jgi:hypothetical protein
VSTPTVVVGVDVGNSTTEVVLARVRGGSVEVLGSSAAPTRRVKGSAESLDGAAALVRRVERLSGVSAEVAVVAPLRPVETSTVTLPEPEARTGRLRVAAATAGTVAGSGWGVGRPVLLDQLGSADDGPVVVVVPSGTGHVQAADRLRHAVADGRVAAVLVADDEAVLVANRLGAGFPVVDEVNPAAVLGAALVAVEVAGPARVLQRVSDPLALVADLGLAESERPDAARLAGLLRDATSAVVALDPERADEDAVAADSGWAELARPERRRVSLVEAARMVGSLPVGAVTAYAAPGSIPSAVDDLFAADLAAVADTVVARVGAQRSRAVALAVLSGDHPATDPSAALAERLGIEVRCAPSEPGAARAGALTTPGASPDAVVVDVGGGTVDVVTSEGHVVAAGAGELLTVGVAGLSGTTVAAAEWVKRGPAARVESPQLLLGENGERQFLDRPAGPETIGALTVRGPAGLLAFDRRHAPGEWRALRLRLKADVLGGNVARALRTLDAFPATVVVVGGPAADDEAMAAVARVLPDGVAIGRGDVAGSLGHRYAVAYGLLLG